MTHGELPETKQDKAPKDRSPENLPLGLVDLPLVEWIPRVGDNADPPYHLQPFPDELDRALTEGGVRCLCACPIRHWKSTTTRGFIAKALLKKPTLSLIVLTHTHDFAKSYGRAARDFCRSRGVRIEPGYDTILDWKTQEGGGLFVMSNRQSAIGRPCDIFIVDDPFANFDDADNIDVRDHVDDVMAMYTARLNAGGSVFAIMSRMHPDDPIGRRMTRDAKTWTLIQKQALIDEGTDKERALAPDIMSVAQLKEKRAELYEVDPSEMVWWSQFQNDPRAQSRGAFQGTFEYAGPVPDDAPTVIGVDAAFSPGKSRDFFAAVVMSLIEVTSAQALEMFTNLLQQDNVRPLHNDFTLVREVVHHQRGTIAVAESLRELKQKYPRARFVAYVSGPEIGVYHLLASMGIFIELIPARWDKATRAKPCAARWSQGRVRVVPGQPWTGKYLREMHAFTGEENGVDDQADGTVAGFDALEGGRGVVRTKFFHGSRRV